MTKQNERSFFGDAIRMRAQQDLAPESEASWLRCVDAARIVWARLTYEELLQTGGDPSKLSGLIETYYGLKRGEAAPQVKEFLENCGTWS
jgi:hypothetical protein